MYKTNYQSDVMNAVPPLEIRKLRAAMELKNLSLRDVSARSGVGYSQCSQILNGRLNHAAYFNRIRRAIRTAPKPLEAIAA